jgi:thymidylate kinase
MLAEAEPKRYIVIDARRPSGEIAATVLAPSRR